MQVGGGKLNQLMHINPDKINCSLTIIQDHLSVTYSKMHLHSHWVRIWFWAGRRTPMILGTQEAVQKPLPPCHSTRGRGHKNHMGARWYVYAYIAVVVIKYADQKYLGEGRVMSDQSIHTGTLLWQKFMPSGHATFIVKKKRETVVPVLSDWRLLASFLHLYTIWGLRNDATHSGQVH